MTAAYVAIVGTLKDTESGEEKQVSLCGMADVIMFSPGSPPPRPHPTPPDPNAPHPEHPIMLPGMPGWGDPHPAHPIFLPGMPGWPEPPKPDETPKWEPKVVWTPSQGWMVVLVPGEGTLVPTPSK